jgi:hypothetical protein
VIPTFLFATNEKTDRDDDIAGKDNTNGDDHGNNNHDHDHDYDYGSDGDDGDNGGGDNGGGNNRWTCEGNYGELRKSSSTTEQPQE